MTRASDPKSLAVFAAILTLLGTCLPAAAAPPDNDKPSGWSADPNAGEAAPKGSMEAPGLTAAEQKRYDAVGLALVKTLNAGDKEAYRKLFTDEAWGSAIPWWRDMFAVQMKRFGKIEKAWAPKRGIIVVGKIGVNGEGEGAGMLVKFEEPAGGLLTFTLDDHDRIAATRVFVKEELGYAEPEGIPLLYDGK